MLYNSNIAFKKGTDALIQSYKDNYWKMLPVERMEINDDILLPGGSRNENFKSAEEKAVKAIQKHGMNIDGKEKNPETAEAYLILGKSRYFEQRFIPALEAFNYISYKHPTSDKINYAKIWREKVNIRLENEETAIKNLKRLIKLEKLSDRELSDAHAMLVQGYVNLKHIDSAITHIKIAVMHTKNKEVKGRLGIIKGQIYNRLGYKDSANIAFDNVIKMHRKTLWIYHVNAQVLKARNFNFEKENKAEYAKHLTKLIENRENRPFLDKLYNLQAIYYKNLELDSLAVVFYNKSIRKDNNNNYLQSLNYRELAAYNFEDNQYKKAGAYYDSTLVKLKKKTKEYRLFKKKKDNLKDVILYEDLVKRNDSILKILNYTEDERITYFENHIAELKTKEAAVKEKVTRNSIAKGNTFSPFNTAGKQNLGKPVLFYFYNPTAVAYGKQEFRKTWGKRTLEIDWRRAKKTTIKKFENEDEDYEENEENETTEKKIEDKYTVEFYTSQLPTELKQKDSVVKKRNFAYYKLGLIYAQKFKEYELAAKRLEKLLDLNPNERLVLPAKYQLYKIYGKINSAKQKRIKQDIITNHPASRYAEILRHPKEMLFFSKGSPEVIYNKLYKQFEAGNYEATKASIKKYIIQFNAHEMLPKYELLKAMIIGKTEGLAAYKKAINYVALTYANTQEGKSAKNTLEKVIPILEKQKFVNKHAGISHKLIYIFNADKIAAKKLVKNINKALEDTYKDHLKVSSDYYTETKNFVVIHGFITPETAKIFQLLMQKKANKYKPTSNYIIASSVNYKIIQIQKNLEKYTNLKK